MRVLVVVVLAAIGAAACGPGPVPKWEYRIVSPADADLPVQLRALGADGWEIISARRATSESGGRREASYELILKRPLSERAAAELLAAPPVPPVR